MAGGVRRLIFVNPTPLADNRYIVGAQVGAVSRSARRALMWYNGAMVSLVVCVLPT